jgi:glucose/arabinose dehydrogenase
MNRSLKRATALPAILLAIALAIAGATAGKEVVPATPEGEGVRHDPAIGPMIGGRPPMPAEIRVTEPPEVAVEVVATGLEVPWDIDWTPDGRLWITERPGRVRVMVDGRLQPQPWLVFDEVEAEGEGGLMGMAVDPRFDDGEPWLYFAFTTRTSDDEVVNQVVRVREESGRPGTPSVLLDGLPGGNVHNGTGLAFGTDGKLYISTGEIWEKERAQVPSNLGGKILRLNPDGTIPADNPLGPGSPVWTLGHRNPQGLAFDPKTGNLWATEHGPSGEWLGIGKNDEVNRILRGKNYGWPLIIGAAERWGYEDPVLAFPDRALPPAGIAFYSGRAVPEWAGDLFFASLRGATLVRVTLDDSTRTRPVRIERLFERDFNSGVFGRLRAVGEGPDGCLYFGTSNRDGRGRKGPDDDRILRLVARNRG